MSILNYPVSKTRTVNKYILAKQQVDLDINAKIKTLLTLILNNKKMQSN